MEAALQKLMDLANSIEKSVQDGVVELDLPGASSQRQNMAEPRSDVKASDRDINI
jgi:hypothetical protein